MPEFEPVERQLLEAVGRQPRRGPKAQPQSSDELGQPIGGPRRVVPTLDVAEGDTAHRDVVDGDRESSTVASRLTGVPLLNPLACLLLGCQRAALSIKVVGGKSRHQGRRIVQAPRAQHDRGHSADRFMSIPIRA